MGDEISKKKIKLGIVILVSLIALSASPVYAFELPKWDDFIDKVRDVLGLQTKPKISANIIIPSKMTVKQSYTSKVYIKISNAGGSSSVHITGKVYQAGKHVDNVDKRLELGKKSELTTEVYLLEPLKKNEGEWLFELSIAAKNERGTDQKIVRGSIDVIGPPLIEAKISKLNYNYSLIKGESKSVTPSLTIKNRGSIAQFNVFIEIKKNNQIVHSTTKSVLINKNEQTAINLYTFRLDNPEHEGKWDFYIKIEASNEAGSDKQELAAKTKFIGEPLIKVERTLDRDRMRRGEDLVIKISLENIGYGDANNVVFDDVILQDFSLIKGSKSFTVNIKEGEKTTFSYIARPSKKGSYSFSSASVLYDGEILKDLVSKSNANQIQVFGIPDLKITRTLSKTTLLEDETVIVSINLKNNGDGAAKSIEFIDDIPRGISDNGGSTWAGELNPNEMKTLSYSAKITSYGGYSFGPGSTVHLDEVGDKEYRPTGETKRVDVFVKPMISYESYSLPDYVERNDNFQISIKLKNAGEHSAPSEWIASAEKIDAVLSLPSGFSGYASKSISSITGGDTKSIDWTLTSSSWGKGFSISLKVTTNNANSISDLFMLDIAPRMLESIAGYDERYCSNCVSGSDFYFFEEGSIKSSFNYWKGTLKHSNSIRPSNNRPGVTYTLGFTVLPLERDDYPDENHYIYYLDSTQSWSNRPFFLTSDYLIYQNWYYWNYDGLNKDSYHHDWERVEMWVNVDTVEVEYIQTDTHYCSIWWKPSSSLSQIQVKFMGGYHTPIIVNADYHAGPLGSKQSAWTWIGSLKSPDYNYENCAPEGSNGNPH